MLNGKSRLYKHPKANNRYLNIPAKMATDSAFPFKDGETLYLEIIDKKLVITKL